MYVVPSFPCLLDTVAFYSFFSLGSRWAWVVKATLRPTSGKDMEQLEGLSKCKMSNLRRKEKKIKFGLAG